MTTPTSRRSRLTCLLLSGSLVLAIPGLSLAEQPMDRIEKLLEGGRASDAETAARKWLERNADDRRRGAVSELLSEAAWRRTAEDPTVPLVRDWRSEFGATSPHATEAFELEGNLVYYAALREPSEAAFRAIVDDYSGTRAGREADEAAAGQGLVEAQAANTIQALSGWLSRYPGHAERDAIRKALDTRVWVRAVSVDTARGWLDLRASFPDHPRAAEAREREARAALAEVQGELGPSDLMKHGTRYGGTEAGRLSWVRVLTAGELVVSRRTQKSWGRLDGSLLPITTEFRSPLSEQLGAEPLQRQGLVSLGLMLPAPVPRRAELRWVAGERVLASEPSEQGDGSVVSLPADLEPGSLQILVAVRGRTVDPGIGLDIAPPPSGGASGVTVGPVVAPDLCRRRPRGLDSVGSVARLRPLGSGRGHRGVRHPSRVHHRLEYRARRCAPGSRLPGLSGSRSRPGAGVGRRAWGRR